MQTSSAIIAAVLHAVPRALPRVGQKAISLALKTEGFYEGTVRHLIEQVYYGNMGGDFIDIMASLIFGQLRDAMTQALQDNGLMDFPPEFADMLDGFVIEEGAHVEQLYRDTVDARVDATPIDPLLDRASLWANRWNEVYNATTQKIAVIYGENLIWEYGETEEHCQTCWELNGMVAHAKTWEDAGVRPQSPPNDMLECGGWKCKCSLTATDQRASPDAYARIRGITTGEVFGG